MFVRFISGCGMSLVLMSAVALAQPPQPTPQPTPTTPAAKQDTPVTLVGCIQRESDYRRATDAGRGGAAATGAGLGNEFVLVNASRGPASGTAPDCTAASAGTAYELTGEGERELAQFVGRFIEVRGTIKEADTAGGKPSGGFDPIGQDLRLPELNVTSSREVMASAATEPEPQRTAAAQTPEPAPPAEQQAARAPQPSTTRQALPATATMLPLIGLIGLLSIGGAIAIRSSR